MWKILFAGAIAAAIAGGSLVLAQQPTQLANAPAQAAPEAVLSEDAAALLDGRIAALKVTLRLTPEQEKMWPPVEAALRDMQLQAALRQAKLEGAQRELAIARPMALLRWRADAMTQTAADLKHLADAAEPLYNTLDEGQKRRLRQMLSAKKTQP